MGKVGLWALISINIPKGAAVAIEGGSYLSRGAYLRNYITNKDKINKNMPGVHGNDILNLKSKLSLKLIEMHF